MTLSLQTQMRNHGGKQSSIGIVALISQPISTINEQVFYCFSAHDHWHVPDGYLISTT